MVTVANQANAHRAIGDRSSGKAGDVLLLKYQHSPKRSSDNILKLLKRLDEGTGRHATSCVKGYKFRQIFRFRPKKLSRFSYSKRQRLHCNKEIIENLTVGRYHRTIPSR